MSPIVLSILMAALAPSQVYTYSDDEGSFTLTIVDETTCEITYGEETKTTTYTYENGVLTIDELSFVVNEDNTLSAYEEKEEEKTFSYEEVEKIVGQKIEEFKQWSEETKIFGYSLAGLLAMIPSVALAIYSAVARKKELKVVTKSKEEIQEDWNNLKKQTKEKIDSFNNDLANYKSDLLDSVQTFQEKTKSCIDTMIENTRVMKEAALNLSKYSEMNQVITTTAKMLKEMAMTPEYVKNGIAEKVTKLFNEGV